MSHRFATVADVSFAPVNGQKIFYEDSRGIVRVPGAGHAANMTHPEVVNGPLVAFLRSGTTSASSSLG